MHSRPNDPGGSIPIRILRDATVGGVAYHGGTVATAPAEVAAWLIARGLARPVATVGNYEKATHPPPETRIY